MTPKRKIFVVDDNVASLAVVEELLREEYEVSLAKSGAQAVRFLEKGGSPDLILLDIDMPDMDGFETLLTLRATDAGHEISVIYLTGIIDAGSEARGLRMGAVDYIRKPVNKQVLLARLALHLENDDKRRQLKLVETQQLEVGGVQPAKLLHMKELLTHTEFAVALLVARGHTNYEIGKQLSYSPAYVKKVVSRLFDRLDIDKRSAVKEFFY
ncbi:Chemotaxis response regulator protein-glutamate methylesterase [bioreactor metagenome]|uniref:Chemotaxis response regulator protein-glutamate methylesterase n=1 Tax=bioreactor metagenome TaxID=1076179 RepID=A0A644SUX0_9ZZZZ|nr:response regulator [Negativicutes bacterium]